MGRGWLQRGEKERGEEGEGRKSHGERVWNDCDEGWLGAENGREKDRGKEVTDLGKRKG